MLALRQRSLHLWQRYWMRKPFLLSCGSHMSCSSYAAQLTRDERSRVTNLFDGLLSRKRASLAESITLVESTHSRKKLQSRFLLELVLEQLRKQTESEQSKSLRIGLSGPPGGGKSTFLEAFGKMLTNMNHRVAVLAVDPSSQGTGGSLLADKTRMPELSVDPMAYIRPSPSRGTLGGVTRNTNDAIILCEGAGYDIILVETVGVGQSEFAVVDMVDLFCLLIPPAGGDELQGIKKGIVEAADLVIVNKFDGDLKAPARRVAAEYMSALKFVRPRHPEWRQKVLKVSSIQKSGLRELWETISEYETLMRNNGMLEARRQEQLKIWMWNYLQDEILSLFRSNPEVMKALPKIEEDVISGQTTPGHGADQIVSIFTSFGLKS